MLGFLGFQGVQGFGLLRFWAFALGPRMPLPAPGADTPQRQWEVPWLSLLRTVSAKGLGFTVEGLGFMV